MNYLLGLDEEPPYNFRPVLPDNWRRVENHWKKFEDMAKTIILSLIDYIRKEPCVIWKKVVNVKGNYNDIWQIFWYNYHNDALETNYRFNIIPHDSDTDKRGTLNKVVIKFSAKAPRKRNEDWGKRSSSLRIQFNSTPNSFPGNGKEIRFSLLDSKTISYIAEYFIETFISLRRVSSGQKEIKCMLIAGKPYYVK